MAKEDLHVKKHCRKAVASYFMQRSRSLENRKYSVKSENTETPDLLKYRTMKIGLEAPIYFLCLLTR